MKLRIVTTVLFAGLSLTAAAYADDLSAATDTDNIPDAQVTQNLTTAAINGSPILNTKNTAAPASNNTPEDAPTGVALTNETDRVSYAMGYEIGRSFKSQNLAINADVMEQGINDGLSGGKTLMSQKDMQNTLNDFQKTLIAKRQAQLNQMSDANKAAGNAFLTANKAKPGVVTLPDGLQYKIIKPGAGTSDSPTDSDLVTVNYSGSFPNGQVFDSSYARGKPVTFPVSEVIQGWSEALKMMKPGAVWEIYVPPALAYGDKGVGPIGPNQTLVFKIELIAVTPATADNSTGSAASAQASDASATTASASNNTAGGKNS